LSFACERGGSKSNLEKMAEAEEVETEARAALEFVSLPDASSPPTGVDASLWSDVGWFPAGIVGISPMREQLPFVDWLRGNLEAYGVDCLSVIDGIERYYMVEHPDGPGQTLVFYGTIDRMRIEDCVRSTLANVPPTASRIPVVTEGAVTRIGEAENAHFIGWVKRGDEVVAIYDTSRQHMDAMLARGDTLAANAGLVELLRDPPKGSLTSMSLKDFGSVFLQVPSVGYSFALTFAAPIEVRATMYFADEATASRASAETDSLIEELETAGLGAGALVNEGTEGSRLRLRLMLDFELMNDPETKLRPVLEVISKRRVKAGLEPIDIAEVLGLAAQATG
jgi:hypothetical protein